MNDASHFLTSLAQAVSTMSLYGEGHPARERAVDAAHERLQRLQQRMPTPQFTFLGEEIVLDQRPVRDLKSWGWGSRFAAVGIQRVELLGPVDRADLEAFLCDAFERMTGARVNTAEARFDRPTNIRYGAVGMRGEEGAGAGGRIATAAMGFTLAEEVDAVGWIHGELKDRKQLHLLEAESIVRSLSVAMHGDQAFVIPLLRLKKFDQYTTTHAMNVSILAMAVAEHIGLSPTEVRTFGISGLLHDLGKVSIPEDILNKPGKLTDAEREVMNRHPIEGARMILETEDQLDLAATVAYEHHIKLNGGGYPTMGYPRRCHQASDLVHVCDVFDALRTDRPYRSAWPTDKVLAYLEEGAGTEFDGDLVRAFVQMMRSWESKVLIVNRPEEPIRAPTEAPGQPSRAVLASMEVVREDEDAEPLMGLTELIESVGGDDQDDDDMSWG